MVPILMGVLFILIIAVAVYTFMTIRKIKIEQAGDVTQFTSIRNSLNDLTQIRQDISSLHEKDISLNQGIDNLRASNEMTNTSMAEISSQNMNAFFKIGEDLRRLGQATSNNTNNYPKLMSRRPIYFSPQSYGEGSVAVLGAVGDKTDGSYTSITTDRKPGNESIIYNPFTDNAKESVKPGFTRLYRVNVVYTDNFNTLDRNGNSKLTFHEISGSEWNYMTARKALELNLSYVWGATSGTQTHWSSRLLKESEIPLNHCWISFQGSNNKGAGTIYSINIEIWDMKYCGCYVVYNMVESENGFPVAVPYLTGPWINNNKNPIKVQKIIKDNGVTYYIVKDGIYVKIATSNGLARYYEGELETFSVDKFNTYNDANGCDCFSPTLLTTTL